MPNPVPLAKQALTEDDAKYNLLEWRLANSTAKIFD